MTEVRSLEIRPAARASGGADLYRRVVRTERTPQLRALFVHGFAEHVGRYEGFARRAASAGIEMHLLDLPGHGRSPGLRGLLEDAETVAHDVAAIAHELGEDGIPVALVGHSFGGAMVLVRRSSLARSFEPWR